MTTEHDVVVQLGNDRWTKTEAGWYREFVVGPDKIVYQGIPDTCERKMLEEIKRLQEIVDEMAAAIDELGTNLFGVEEGKTWKDAKATWWQRCVRAVEVVEKANKP